MTVIKEGYSGKPLEIKVYAREGGMAELWTEMFDGVKRSEFEVPNDDLDSDKFRTEVLHYATLSELIELRDELNVAIKELAGV